MHRCHLLATASNATHPTTDINDDEPQDEEIRPVVVAAKRGKAKGIDLVQANNIKTWLWKMECEEDYEEEVQKEEEETDIPWDLTKPLKRAGRGDQWRKFVAIIQSVWRTGVTPRHLLRAIIVLIPKGNIGDFRGIDLMQPMWKIIKGIMERRLQKLERSMNLSTAD